MEPESTELPEYGERLGDRYRIDAEVARGGVGVVFRARDLHLQRTVAVKVLPRRVDRGAKRERFLREARNAAKVGHPRVVTIFDAGFFRESRPYLVMELLDGTSLHRRVQTLGPLEPAEACTMAAQVAGAAHALHGLGMLHRDLKPGNVFLLRSDALDAKIIDFGMSKRLDGLDTTITEPGRVIGTPSYMAPEQLLGRELDARADVYGIGQTLYESLVGRPMITRYREIDRIFDAILTEPVRAPSEYRRDVPSYVDAICLCACAKEPSQRFTTALELRTACEAAAARAARGDA
ncbi:MAG: serine/threonine-protein kinase [Myxococcota bacterium]